MKLWVCEVLIRAVVAAAAMTAVGLVAKTSASLLAVGVFLIERLKNEKAYFERNDETCRAHLVHAVSKTRESLRSNHENP